MSSGSVLFRGLAASQEDPGEPDHFRDLNLDQVVASITANRHEYHLEALFNAPLLDVETVRYRQAVCRDLEDERVRKAVSRFADGMTLVRHRQSHSQQRDHRTHRLRWHREAARVYCDVVAALRVELNEAGPESAGLQAMCGHLAEYVESANFRTLADDGEALDEELATIRYTVHIDGDRVEVHRYEGGDDYRHDVEAIFSRFERTDVEDRRVQYSAFSDLNRVEAQVLDLVADLFPRPFGRLAAYCTTHSDFIDPQVERFDREVQFYLAWLDFISPMRTSGLPFSYPIVSDTSKETRVVGSFDIALAAKSGWHSREIVPNDFRLSGAERILVVTGPNQGGKTTFARMFGQLHYLASLGLPVPGETVELPLPDRVFTIFEREEHIETLRGKLADELLRMREIFEHATADSIVVVNEGFSSTTLLDAEFLGGEVVKQMIEKGLTGVFVTFVDELSTMGRATVSMVATVDPDDPKRRTLRVVRRPADGRAYAAAIAARYGLSYERLKDRICP